MIFSYTTRLSAGGTVILIAVLLMLTLPVVGQASAGYSKVPSSAGPLSAERTVQFTYRSTVELPDSGPAVSVHIPMPEETRWQQVRTVSLSGVTEPSVYYDSEYGNKILRYTFTDPDGRSVTLKQTYHVRRIRRVAGSASSISGDSTNARNAYYSQYLDHHQYMRTNTKIKQIARTVEESSKSYRGRLRVLFDRVREMMTYDKSGRGWGRGDISYCLRVGKGNCTDFHTLFTSIAKEVGIPSRFVMGFPIPRSKTSGSIGGYHCWAESYLPGIGWFPMDISEADRHPDLVDFYFGTLDADRIQFTRGKNIPLSTGKRVNYLVYPEVTGNDNVSVQTRFSFRNR